MGRFRCQILAGVVPAYVALTPCLVEGGVDLELRSEQTLVNLGENVAIALYALSASVPEQNVSSVQVILTWDPLRLELLGATPPCTGDPCPPGTYNWSSSGFPVDTNGDGLNADCGEEVFCEPYTGIPFNDGDALYLVLSQFSPAPWAIATDEGLWVTTFVFRAKDAGLTELRIEERLGARTLTRVVGGAGGGDDVTGVLGPPAVVDIVACLSPTVTAIGSRYLAITPMPREESIALLLTGYGDDPAVACVSRYVQADGRLGTSPMFRTPAEWGTVYVADGEVIPSTIYRIRGNCGLHSGQEVFSSSDFAETWLWGDVNHDGNVMLDDVALVFDGTQGIFHGDSLPENVDLAPCAPDGVIDGKDLVAAEAALSGAAYPCRMPCAAAPNLDDLAGLVGCLMGPGGAVALECYGLDGDGDGDVDLVDFSGLQTGFEAP